ncbi:probable E3 ubiquitin-protein ligase BAH1-like 1 isoform X2 [Spinacia oleracea]|uniref:Probable E3 ubiquitin-protein ligase BAH1-like 1 isoform X2 n=1 Tax=Spinacia oleracea TaxID=3562 RepID=A0A9R0J7H2_SPIOL|nr:probable E3 ubiquitin-protein ligase BAH1-like 1 isoform X2 [Spinacia oleracea]
MKFCKSYENYMKQFGKKTLPGIGYRKLKKLINKCRTHNIQSFDEAVISPPGCSVCDGNFFPSLFDEMLAVVDCFDKEAQKLLDPPLSCPWRIWVHKCEKGREFKSGAQTKHIEVLQSPWFYELMSFQINSRDRKLKATSKDASLFEGLDLIFNNDNPSMSCELFDSFRIDVELICPICLDIVFDAVALRCGHILCYMCACSAASVNIVDGLKAATPNQKCPLCREVRVYGDATRLEELNILLSKRCPEYWGKRLESERVERLRLVKEHWQSQLHGLMTV